LEGIREDREKKRKGTKVYSTKEEKSISNEKHIIIEYYLTRIRPFLRGRNRGFENFEASYTSNVEI
jgi:hypothetical protein